MQPCSCSPTMTAPSPRPSASLTPSAVAHPSAPVRILERSYASVLWVVLFWSYFETLHVAGHGSGALYPGCLAKLKVCSGCTCLHPSARTRASHFRLSQPKGFSAAAVLHLFWNQTPAIIALDGLELAVQTRLALNRLQLPALCLFDISHSYWSGVTPHSGWICISLMVTNVNFWGDTVGCATDHGVFL